MLIFKLGTNHLLEKSFNFEREIVFFTHQPLMFILIFIPCKYGM